MVNLAEHLKKDAKKEHLHAPSLIYDHYSTKGHTTTVENFSTVASEDQNLARSIKKPFI